MKLGAFKAEHKNRMKLYLRWLAKSEQEPDEQSPVAIILCAGKKQEQIELLELEKRESTLWQTGLPPRESLEAKLHQFIQSARTRLADDEGKERS